MKFLLRLVLIIVLGFVVSFWFPWWSVAVVGGLIGILFSEKRKRRMFGTKRAPARAFLAGFLAVFILWGGMALWIDGHNGSLLSEKISKIIIPQGEIFLSRAWLMILVTALIGGLTGGFSTMTGNLLGEAVRGNEKD